MGIKEKLEDGINKSILYTAVVLDNESRTKLLQRFTGEIPGDWKIIAHHMTITFGQPLSTIGLEAFNGNEVDLTVTHLGKSDDAIAVKVYGFKTTNKIPHITLAVPQGNSPVKSNQIKNWGPLEERIDIKGVVTEFFK